MNQTVLTTITITGFGIAFFHAPCEGFLPIYVSGIRYGWTGFTLLTVILSIATVAGMMVFTRLTLLGLTRLRLRLMEKYESALMSGVLCIVGVLIILFEK